MASKSSAAKTSESTALATAPRDELADILGDVEIENDGLEELGGEDIKIGVKVANFKGVDEAGDPIPANVFYDTVDETTQKTIDAALLTFHKSNEWREFDKAQNKSVTYCKSFDRVTGEMNDGKKRACAGCPDQEWTTDASGKRTRRCGTVYNLIGVERLTQKAFIFRARRTAVDPLKLYLNKHFIGRRVTPKGTGNYPLFAFQTKISLKMETKAGTSWAVPVFERGDVQTREEILACEKNATFYRESLMPVLEKAEAHEGDAGEAPDTSFDTDAMDAQPPAAKGANHF
jgi:hypothetical protein